MAEVIRVLIFAEQAAVAALYGLTLYRLATCDSDRSLVYGRMAICCGVLGTLVLAVYAEATVRLHRLTWQDAVQQVTLIAFTAGWAWLVDYYCRPTMRATFAVVLRLDRRRAQDPSKRLGRRRDDTHRTPSVGGPGDDS